MTKEIFDSTKDYKSLQDALNEIKNYADDWSSAVGSLGVKATYAIIGANWAVHSSPGKLLSNPYSTISVGLCIGFLMLILLLTELMTEWLRHRWQKAVDEPQWWIHQWELRANTKWPYTEGIERLARWLRYLKSGAPIAAGLFFILSLFLK